MPIGPDIWGVHGWKFIHHVALGYPNTPNDNDINNYKFFFLMLGNVLPCHICSDHYNQNLLIHPLTNDVLSNRINLINWTIDMHNEVNKTNGKKIYGYDEALKLIRNNYKSIEEYSNLPKPKPKPEPIKKDNTMLYIAFAMFIVLIVIAVVYKKK